MVQWGHVLGISQVFVGSLIYEHPDQGDVAKPTGQVEGRHPAVVLVVDVGPGLQEVGDVGQPGLLTGGVVQGSPAQPVPAVQDSDHLGALVTEDELDDTLTAPPDTSPLLTILLIPS